MLARCTAALQDGLASVEKPNLELNVFGIVEDLLATAFDNEEEVDTVTLSVDEQSGTVEASHTVVPLPAAAGRDDL